MSNTVKPPIAVVAVSGVFPKATGIDRFWKNIIDKFDASIDASAVRWPGNKGWVFANKPGPDQTYSVQACLVDTADIAPPAFESKAAIPFERYPALFQWVLYAAMDAFTQSNIQNIDTKRIGTILAAIVLPTRFSNQWSHQILESLLMDGVKAGLPDSISPTRKAALVNRVVAQPAALVAQVLGLGGGTFTLDAACASSLYAVKLACDELQAYRADAMITGGVSAADTLYTQIGFSQLRALSPSGRCAPFDKSADGLVVGEGAGMMVLKRLDDALRDEDTIYGVIRGIGLSNDMRGNLLAPESEGQLRAMRAAYNDAQWQPQDIDYIECHGAGTPVGDATELRSLRTLWQAGEWRKGQCAIGSVKSMIGHLLTGAGAAGMIKTLLALHHRILPPTLHFHQPADNSPLIDGPFRVQTIPAHWAHRSKGTPRRAAVSAFGFGGINAHLLLEEWRERDEAHAKFTKLPLSPALSRVEDSASLPVGSKDIAIVGMEVCLGTLSSLNAFQHAIFNSTSGLADSSAQRWKAPAQLKSILGEHFDTGGFIKEIILEIGEFQIPPGEILDILPQQLLMLKVAADAMRDAGLPLREPRERMGTIIGVGFDYEACNFNLRWTLPETIDRWRKAFGLSLDDERLERWLQSARDSLGPPLTPSRTLGALGGIVASRIAREFRLGGPSFVVSAEEASGLRAVEIAMRLLQAGQTDAMLVGAVDLACDERNLTALFDSSTISASGRVKPFDQTADGTLPGEGAVALVIKRLSDAKAAHDRIYAVISGIGDAHGSDAGVKRPTPSAYFRSLEKAFADAGASPTAIDLMETHASGNPLEDDIEVEAVNRFFEKTTTHPSQSIAMGMLKPLTGHTGATAGLASLAKTTLCLFHQLIPPSPNFISPRQSTWENGPFYFPRQTTYWASDHIDEVRTACVAAMTQDGNCMHVILKEPGQDSPTISSQIEEQQRRPMGPLPYALFLLSGDTAAELLNLLDQLEIRLQQCLRSIAPEPFWSMEKFGHEWFLDNKGCREKNARLSILVHSPEDLGGRIHEARQAVQEGRNQSMGARGGICYLPGGAHSKGQVAFIYPGSGCHDVGMGRMLGAHWPAVFRDMHSRTDRLRSQMLSHLYDPWRTDWLPGWQSQSYQAISTDALHGIFGQVIFGSQMTRLLRSFNIHPDAAIGYSLGESAGLFALGAWLDHGRMLERLSESDLFKTQLTGSCRSLRQAWDLPEDQTVRWRVAVINRPASRVDKAIAEMPHVRRLITNTPNECVIGGLHHQVVKVIQKLKCEALDLDGVITVHCDAAQPVARAYEDLHRFPTTPVPGVRFYSCARGEAYALTSEAAADSIKRQALEGFDFTKTIRQAHADGVRLFVEVGPQSSCTRMIRQILGDLPHLAVAAHMRGEDEVLTLLKCLGTVAAAGVAVDLGFLYGYRDHHFCREQTPGTDAIHVPVGGQPICLPPLPLTEPKPNGDEKWSKPMEVSASMAQNIDPKPVDQGCMPPEFEYLKRMMADLGANAAATARAHEQFLQLSQELTRQFGETFQLQNELLEMLIEADGEPPLPESNQAQAPGKILSLEPAPFHPVAFTRQQCLEFAIGSVGKVLGPQFDIIDSHKVRVRLPDEPLMLVDRILQVEGEKCSLGSGRVITEHDVLPGAWYLDGDRAPVCISVEAGQADLFLSSYLGIDHQVKGERAYRLLDAKIHFHRGLPRPGEIIRYDIHIDKFVKQGATYLFFFRFEGYISHEHLITMTDGCAGFFTEQEVRNSGGIILTEEDRESTVRINGGAFEPLLPLADEAYTDGQLEALRSGEAGRCFGPLFEGIQLPPALRLPGGRMRLIDRVIDLEPSGGSWGLGCIRAEADIHREDWFLNCHFVDDKVMPGTLMYECCAHTLRVLLLRLGWLTDRSDVAYEPIQGVPCRLKCRGPVTPGTRHVHYVVEIKEIGYHPEPCVLADAHMYADGHYIVFFKDMSMQMTGVSEDEIRLFWQNRHVHTPPIEIASHADIGAGRQERGALFSRQHILEFAVGSPSKAYGERYRVFDRERTIARLPGPPYCFMDRIIAIEPKPWILKADGWIEAQYDIPADEWYFAADRSGIMPFCVLLEIALQPCGWLAAYAGSALKTDKDLKFRNLGGKARQHANLMPSARTLTMRTRITKVSEAADMIIEHFDFEVVASGRPIYTGNTYFGFFTRQALAQQVGLREAHYTPDEADLRHTGDWLLVDEAPLTPDESPKGHVWQPSGLLMPAKALSMIDGIDLYHPEGGPHGLGYVRGFKKVDPEEWFFKAHFYQDPVCPGSLGVESFLQLIKYAALRKWPELAGSHHFEMLLDHPHEWQYRGQVIPANRKVVVEAVLTHVEENPEPVIMADGWLQVDGLYIYGMKGFGIKLRRLEF